MFSVPELAIAFLWSIKLHNQDVNKCMQILVNLFCLHGSDIVILQLDFLNKKKKKNGQQLPVIIIYETFILEFVLRQKHIND